MRQVNSTNLDKGKVEVWGLIFFFKKGVIMTAYFLFVQGKRPSVSAQSCSCSRLDTQLNTGMGFLGTDVQKV